MTEKNDVKTTIENSVAEDVTPEKKQLTKKTKIIISIVSIVIVLAIIISSCFIWQNQNIKLVSNTKTIEYGEKYIPNLSDFVEEKNIKNYSIDGNIPNEEGKKYKLTVKKNKKSEEVTVKVKDTVAPTFAEDIATTISTVVNTPLDDVTAQYKDKVTDLDDVKVTVNSANVNYGVVGEYKSELIATDESGNTSKKEIMVVVNEKNQVNSSNNSNKTSSKTSSKPNKPSSNGSSNSKPSKHSSGNNGSSSKPTKPSGGNGGSNSGESTTTKPTHCTTNSNHSIKCGNMGRWFNSRTELVNYYKKIVNEWNTKYENGTISWDELMQNCPRGYECWSCSYCGKWTGNYKYK